MGPGPWHIPTYCLLYIENKKLTYVYMTALALHRRKRLHLQRMGVRFTAPGFMTAMI